MPGLDPGKFRRHTALMAFRRTARAPSYLLISLTPSLGGIGRVLSHWLAQIGRDLAVALLRVSVAAHARPEMRRACDAGNYHISPETITPVLQNGLKYNDGSNWMGTQAARH